MPSTRRALLASIGAAATGVAGCLGGPDRDGSAGSPTPTSTSTSTPTATPSGETATLGDALSRGDLTVIVSDLVAAHSVRYLTAPDAMGVTSAGDDQFVFVDVAVRGEGRPPAPDAFALVADGTRYPSGVADVGPSRVDAPVSGRRYGESNRQGYLAFRVPAPLLAEEVAVTLADAGRWTLPTAAADPLRSPPPSFSARIEVPESVAAADPIPVRLAVTNEGDGDGVFRGAINHQGPLYSVDPFAIPVAAGESRTHQTRTDYYVGDEAPPGTVQFGVVGPGVSASFSVTVEGGGTPSGTGESTTTGTATR